ncbi:MAG TPA: hypothetical protein VFG51_00005, partial [Candidatus Saccharimonadia bacterium]|nr:hypothetical protein [Candidatus Saccharimonadia bacterium]
TVPSRAQRPAVYAWLEQSNITAVAHVPPYVYNMPQGKLEPWRMLFSLPDHRSYSMYDGYSGFAPQDRVTDMIIINQTFPSQHSIDLMKENGVQGIVVHLDELTPEQRQAFGSLLLNRSYKDATTEVIRL